MSALRLWSELGRLTKEKRTKVPIQSFIYLIGSQICVEVDKKVNMIILKKPKDPGEMAKTFSYDSVYDWNSTQRSVYDESAFPLVESVIEGYNGTIFAYGQVYRYFETILTKSIHQPSLASLTLFFSLL